ncbi:hypothetical protein [Longispora albida]|uniref:hypothetical protein n=1 Tax=Longispora albida TaxID=203523 RepID=UPI000367295A|nr:hypothetical protein [Longispora albida]
MSAVGGYAREREALQGFDSPVELARHYRLLAERLLAEGRAGEAADALRAGLLAIEAAGASFLL